ncbi:hypothetical protein IAU60_001522 [Kwoniella sp. DSM 27419]
MAPVRKRGPQPGTRKTTNRSISPRVRLAKQPAAAAGPTSDRWSNRPSRAPTPPTARRTPASDPSPTRSGSEGRQQRVPFGGVPGKLVDRLLPLYFTHVHNVWPLVYKPTFNPHTASLPLLLSMLAIAACVTPAVDGEATPADRLFRMAEKSVHECRNDCRIDIIQALILLSLRQTGCGDKRSASMYAGRACCMALNMGLNLAPKKLGKVLDPIDKEVRSRVYWNTYVLDKTVAEETGRPFLLSYRRTTTPLPSTTDLEEFEAWPPPTLSATVSLSVGVIPRRGNVLSCFAWTCRLAMVVENVLDLETQPPPTTNEWDTAFINDLVGETRQDAERAAKQLESWRQAMPPHLAIDRSVSPLPHQAVLLAWYHTTCILFYSRFIRSRDPAGSPLVSAPNFSSSARQICSEAAQETIDILSLLDRHHLLSVASSDMLHILSLAALFEAFNATSSDMDVAHKAKVNFAQCCIWLRDFSSSWPAASSHRLFFEGLIQGGLRLSSNDLSQPSDPLSNSSETIAESPSMPAGLHAIRRHLSISESTTPVNFGSVSPASTAPSLNPANLFQLPQLYWNHLNTASNNQNHLAQQWDPSLDFTMSGSGGPSSVNAGSQLGLTADTPWDNHAALDIPDSWLEPFGASGPGGMQGPDPSVQQESTMTADAVQSALMSFMMQAARGTE